MAAGYGEELLGRVSGMVAACTRRVSRATRRLLRRHYHRDGAGGQRRRKLQQQTMSTTTAAAAAGSVVAAALCARGAAIDKGRVSSSSSGEALWSRRILMGERCQPLDFAGAIHYDSFGRRLARPPMPRSTSSLSYRSPSSGSGRSTTDDADADGSDTTYPENYDVVDSPSS